MIFNLMITTKIENASAFDFVTDVTFIQIGYFSFGGKNSSFVFLPRGYKPTAFRFVFNPIYAGFVTDKP